MSLAAADSSSARHQQQADMRLVPGGTFRMGSDKHYHEEAPVHRVSVDGFWMDRTPVTNRRFREFVEATGYVTFAELAPDPKDYPGALPGGWLGEKTKPDVPYLINLRLDPFERTGWPDSGTKYGAQQYFDWFKYEFWRFVFVQQQVEKLAMTAIEFPPMQKGASFNLDAVKAKIEAARNSIAR